MTSLWCTVLNVFLYLVQVLVENSDASPAHRAPLVENPDLKVPLLSRSSYFQSSCEAGQWKKEGGGGGSPAMKSGIASYLYANAIISCTLQLSRLTHGARLRSHVELPFLRFPAAPDEFLMTPFIVHDMYLRDEQPLGKRDITSLFFVLVERGRR